MNPRTQLCAALFGLLAACTSDSDEWAGTRETLPNGAVRVTNSGVGLREGKASWRLEQELVLGETEGDSPALFSSIAGLEVSESGRIYVLDRQANELRIFDGAGTHVRTVGRTGQGPGEYSQANGLVWLTPDSLIVVDQRGARYSVLTADGDYVRSVRRRLGYWGWVFQGGYHDGRVWESTSVRRPGAGELDPMNPRPDDYVPALLGTRVTGTVSTAEAASASPDTDVSATVDTILLPLPQLTGPMYEAFQVRTRQGGMVMDVPFAPRAFYTLTRDGTVWFGHGASFLLTHITLSGDTLAEWLVQGATATPVSQDELTKFEQSESVKRFRELGGELDMDRIPTVKPFFDQIAVADDGHIWVGVPAPPLHTIFAVFDPEGRYLGRFEVPGSTRMVYIAPIIRNGRIYWVGLDELEVERVHVYRIQM